LDDGPGLPTIVDLGPHPDVRALNDKGVVVGQANRARVYRNDRWHDLPAHSIAYAINERGDVAGGDKVTHVPVLFPHGEAPVDLGLPAGGLSGWAQGVNRKRLVVGSYQLAGGPRCFAWTSDAGSVDMGLMKKGTQCGATAVNEAGQVTGSANATDSPFFFRAFVWQDGVFTDLGTLRGEDSSFGMAINDAGHVVGTTSAHAFLWNGRMIDLDPKDQFVSSVATSINNQEEIVGFASHGQTQNVAVRFSEGHVIELMSEIPDARKWSTLIRATSINDEGVIVGFGLRYGDSHAFMLVPQAAAEAAP